MDHPSEAKFYDLPHDIKGHAFEFVIERLIQSLPLARSLVFDAGANYGGHTMTLLRAVGLEGCVVAVEPDPDLAAQLSAWKTVHPNLLVENAAILDREGRATFRIAANQKGYGSLFDRPKYQLTLERTIDVPLTTIDRLAAKHREPVKFIKADVEGAEVHLILGAEQTLRTARPLIAIEMDWQMHDQETLGRFFQTLASVGYQARSVLGKQINAPYEREWVAVLTPQEFDVGILTTVGMQAVLDFKSDWHVCRKFEM
jgi:FkbM family methyltransferase